MKSGTTLSIAVRNQANNEVTFAVPLAGFGDAFDGRRSIPRFSRRSRKSSRKS